MGCLIGDPGINQRKASRSLQFWLPEILKVIKVVSPEFTVAAIVPINLVNGTVAYSLM